MHQSVLLNEVLDLLKIKKDGRYLDGTLGLGGHAEGILRKLGPRGRLLGLDVDPDNLRQAEDRLQPFGDQTITRQVNFRGLQEVLRDVGWENLDGMIFDLGVSSTQLDDPERGFSFRQSGPLDMRLDPDLPETALDVLRHIDEETLTGTLREFGENRDARRISRYLLHDVSHGRMKTTGDLAGFCERVIRRRGKVHPATRVFLALRCLVNNEIEVLREILRTAPLYLGPGGRLAIISFHSLEDREVKTTFRNLAQQGLSNRAYGLVTRKPVVPDETEMRDNPRSRSARLRVLERKT